MYVFIKLSIAQNKLLLYVFLVTSFGSTIEPTSDCYARTMKTRTLVYQWDKELPLYFKRYTVNAYRHVKFIYTSILSEILKTVLKS
jgi:hypothetical protein